MISLLLNIIRMLLLKLKTTIICNKSCYINDEQSSPVVFHFGLCVVIMTFWKATCCYKVA